MRYSTWVWFVCLWNSAVLVGYGQESLIHTDSTYTMPTVTIHGASSTSNDQVIDSSQVLLNNAIGIGGLLKFHSLIYIKDYGPGNLSTVSARGGSASQSQVFWNGININQAGLGLTDLSTLPPFLLDQITVQQSASGAVSGSGAMAGNVLLDNKASNDSGAYVLLKQTVSSIGEKSTGIRIGYNHGKVSSDVRFFYLNSDNTYHFINTSRPTEEEQTQHHAGLLQYGYSANVHYNLNARTILSIYSWYTQFNRDIPPTLQTITRVSQKDEAVRNSIQLEHRRSRSLWHYKIAYLKDGYGYWQRSSFNDSIIQQDHGITHSLIQQLDHEWTISKQWQLQLGASHVYQSIHNESYAQGGHDRHRIAVYGGLKWQSINRKTQCRLLFREEYFGTQWSPLIYSLHLDQRLLQNITLSIKGERYYRIPSLNDLYWGQGGNPDLRPENGWGMEAAIAHQCRKAKFRNFVTVNVFDRWVNDWMLWTPTGEYSYWAVTNIGKVWARGIEFKEEARMELTSQFSITCTFQHTFQRATQEVSKSLDDQSYGKQLMYTPVYLGNVGLQIQYRQFAISYYHQYTSWVFIQSDESDFIDPYQYGVLRLQVGGTITKHRVDAFGEIDNCWNTSYQTVKDRPMPLRYFRAGIVYKWN